MFCGKFHRLLDASILNYQFSIIMILLLLEAGDVERNPGPNPDHTLSFLHLNIRSIRNKIDFLKDNFMDFEVLCFSETHLDITVSSESLGISDCYSNPYRKDRNSHGGGLLMYINTSLAHKRRPDLEIFCDESIWAELKVKQEIYLIGLFYSPTTADQTFFNNFNVNIERALEISNNLILVGDLNEDLLNINYRNLRDILLINSLQNVISSPTRQNAILDPILIHEDMPYCDSGVIDTPANISDHKATFLIIPFDCEIKTSYTRLIWLYKKANFENLKYKLSTQNWDCLTEGSIEEACTTFTNIFLDMVKTCIPSKEITVRPDDKPWYDHEIRHFTLKRDRVKRKLTKSCSNVLREQYKHLRNKVNNLKKHAKEKFYNNLESSITDFYSNDRKQFWKTIRYFVKNNNSTTSIPPLKSTLPNGQITTCYTDYEKAECLNEYFASISTINDDNCQLPTFEFKCLNRLSNISCSADGFKTLIDILNPNKASGPDGISNKMLKPVAQEVAQPLSILFNRSFREGKFAESWKHSNVIPLPKKGDKSEPSNFRPVSLLSGLGKLQERIAFKHIHNYLIENNLIYKYQSGFLPGHSTTFQLIDIYHHICQAIDNSQYACMVFCDVSKAFDRVWHRGLIFKLKQIGINGNLLEWVSNYLNNRQQRVVIKSCKSDYKRTNAGVPQGSVLGPLLFLIYVNDISESLLSLTRLFADDSSLFYSATSIRDIEGIINSDLKILSNWAKQWLINFNPLKTEAILFTLKQFVQFPNLIFNNTIIQFVNDHKHLGLTLSNTGQWHKHIENILASASKIIGTMRRLKFSLSRVALNQIYFSFVLPVLEYSSVVWDGCSQRDEEALERLQNEAARIVTGLTRSVSIENLYAECGWRSLAERRKHHKLTFMYRANNNLVPTYITDLIPPVIRETTNYPLRNQNNITTPYCRTELFKKSCIPSSISLWNSADDNLRNCPSIDSFKFNLKKESTLTKVPIYYTYGDRFLSVMHARIRNKCSNLSNDLCLNHLTQNPFCSCNSEIENAEHYFFRCSKYVNERITMFRETHSFHPLNLNKLLTGDSNLTIENNAKIFEAVQKYIKNTKRFSNT